MPSIVYVINNTQGSVITAIPPTGENTSVSDLRLYGLGNVQWGEGVNENQYRLTENFACPEKISAPGNPQDETDLGAGNGINDPVNGQLWFNTTQKKIFVFDATIPGWKIVGGAAVGPLPPASPQVGDLWFDTALMQLKIWDGFAFISVAERYVLKSGDTMTGVLAMSSNKITGLADGTASGDALHFGQLGPGGAVQAQDDDLDALAAITTTGILVRTGSGTAATRTITGDATISVLNGNGVLGDPQIGLATVTQTSGGLFNKFTVNSVGQVTQNTPVTTADMTPLLNSTYVNVTGDTMSGALTVNNNMTIQSSLFMGGFGNIFAGSQRILNVAPGILGTDAVNLNQLNANPSLSIFYVPVVAVGSGSAPSSGSFDITPYIGGGTAIAAILQYTIGTGGPDSGPVFTIEAGSLPSVVFGGGYTVGVGGAQGGGDNITVGGQATIGLGAGNIFYWRAAGGLIGFWNLQFIGFYK